MSQTIRRSWLESWTNILLGFSINYLANIILLPLFGFKSLTWKTNIYLGIIYTSISLLRSFAVRRFFNKGDL